MEELSLVISQPDEGKFLQKIGWNKEQIMNAVAEITKQYTGLTYTEEQMQDAKKDRAKGSLEGKMTITIDVSFTEETVQNRDPNIEGDMRIVHTPKFQHKVGSVLQIKNEQKGDMNCDGMEMIWDNEKGEYVLRPITGRDQMSIFDMEVQNAQESATDAEVVEGEVLEGRKIPALPMNEPEDDESDGSPQDGPQDEEDMSDEFGDDYGYDDPEEY